jgi:hypothetical protein
MSPGSDPSQPPAGWKSANGKVTFPPGETFQSAATFLGIDVEDGTLEFPTVSPTQLGGWDAGGKFHESVTQAQQALSELYGELRRDLQAAVEALSASGQNYSRSETANLDAVQAMWAKLKPADKIPAPPPPPVMPTHHRPDI